MLHRPQMTPSQRLFHLQHQQAISRLKANLLPQPPKPTPPADDDEPAPPQSEEPKQERVNIGRISLIKVMVARHYGITVEQMNGSTRKAKFVLPRFIAIYLARRCLKMSLGNVGRAFGLHHTTVMHALGRVESLMQRYPDLAATIEEFVGKIPSTAWQSL